MKIEQLEEALNQSTLTYDSAGNAVIDVDAIIKYCIDKDFFCEQCGLAISHGMFNKETDIMGAVSTSHTNDIITIDKKGYE